MFERLRRPNAPPEVSVRLDVDDRVLAVAATTDGRTLTATRRGLWISDSSSSWLVPWESVVTAVWGDSTLTVTEGVVVEERPGYVVMERRPPWRAKVLDSRGLHAAVHDRVVRSVAVTERHDVGGQGVLLTARRLGGRTTIRWAMVFDTPGAFRDPAVLERAEALLSSARSRRGS